MVFQSNHKNLELVRWGKEVIQLKYGIAPSHKNFSIGFLCLRQENQDLLKASGEFYCFESVKGSKSMDQYFQNCHPNN